MRGVAAYKRKVEELTELSRKVEKMRRKLAERCEHPSEFVKDYSWEHDNGYGRQTKMTGKWCHLCYGKDLWNSGTFSKSETW